MKAKSKDVHRWSRRVMETSNALDLEPSVFTWSDPKRIAESLKRSAEASTRRKAEPCQSAMSMLNFHINRGGKNILASHKRILERQSGVAKVVRNAIGT